MKPSIRFVDFLFGELGHFHNLLCEEMIFPLHKGKNYGLRYDDIIFSRGQWKYNFFTQKVVEMQFPLF